MIERGGWDCAYLQGLTNRVGRHLRHAYVDIFAHIFIVLDLCQVFWTLSWLNHTRFTNSQEHILEAMRLTSIVFFALHRAYVWCYRKQLQLSIVFVFDTIILGLMLGNFSRCILDSTLLRLQAEPAQWRLQCAFAAWRIGRIYLIGHGLRNPSVHSVRSSARRSMGNHSLHLLWLTSSTCSVLSLVAKLKPLMEELLLNFSQEQLLRIFALRVHLHGASAEGCEAVREEIHGTIFQHMIRFDRADINGWVQERMHEHLRPNLHSANPQAYSTMVAFCGNPNLGKVVGRAVQAANLMAVALQQPRCRLDFREEYYGAATTKKPVTKGSTPTPAAFKQVREVTQHFSSPKQRGRQTSMTRLEVAELDVASPRLLGSSRQEGLKEAHRSSHPEAPDELSSTALPGMSDLLC